MEEVWAGLYHAHILTFVLTPTMSKHTETQAQLDALTTALKLMIELLPTKDKAAYKDGLGKLGEMSVGKAVEDGAPEAYLNAYIQTVKTLIQSPDDWLSQSTSVQNIPTH